MNNNIRDAFETLNPTEAQKSRMLSGIKSRISEKAAKPAHRGRWLCAAAIAAALCCIFSMTVFAEEIGSFIAGIFSGNAIVGEEVKTNVFSDTDGHVEMSVEEVVSDLCNVRVVICYTALDEQGREWLASLSKCGSDPVWYNEDSDFRLRMWTVEKGYSAGGATSAYELEEYRTKNQRRFVLFMELVHDYWGNEAWIRYSMTDNLPRSTVIDVSTNIEKRIYDLNSPQETDRLYRPTFVKLSPLSITVCGENLGAFYYKEYADGLYTAIGSLYDNVTVQSMRLIFTDGTEIVMFKDGCACQDMAKFGPLLNTDDPDDCIIVAMSFAQPIDPDAVVGMEIDGVYYPFG
ncbi:MAG: hypothetical protein E7559_03010 [Ruminococcaceae bacterium]|nr:hypothetical protein [Oscillospiraceae bacterium]